MGKYIFDEKNGFWYELQGDYYLPCLKLPEEEQQPAGVWGQQHLRSLKNRRKAGVCRISDQRQAERLSCEC